MSILVGLAMTLMGPVGCNTADVIGAHVLKGMLAPDATVIPTRFEVAPAVNPDPYGRPSPIWVRVYLLTSASVFEGSDFFQLRSQDQDLLGKDLKLREELVLRPGEEHDQTFSVPPEEDGPKMLYFAVLAGFRDLEHARWRDVVEVKAGKKTPVRVELDELAVTLDKAR
jgi:type VI secretion system protein VasD